MPVFNLTVLIRLAAKAFFIVVIIGLIQTLVTYVLSHIPSLQLVGCMGYYADKTGLIYGMRLLLSIVVYGFVAKFVISIFSRYLD